MTPKSQQAALVPGRSIGPFQLGTTVQELETAGLQLASHPSGQLGSATRVSDAYTLVFDRNDRLVSVTLALSSKSALVIGGNPVPVGASLEEVARRVGDCDVPQVTEGGILIRCHGGSTIVKAGADETSGIEVQVLDESLR